MVKAQEMSIYDLLYHDHSNEHTTLKDSRIFITSSEAWGVLRKDLINTLGIARAKRFLLRYGWHCGVNEALMLKEWFDWDDDLEWLVAGSKMHNLAGRVFSYPKSFDVNMEQGTFHVEGNWLDSYEAKQHLKHFELYHEPVCFYLVGYAGGYVSECMGKRVIFKEVSCLGKGDPHCSYVGKTVEQWGEDIQEELIDYEQVDLADELDRAYKKIEQQRETLILGASISKKLTKSLLQEHKLDRVASILGENLHCSVFIENQYYERLAKYGSCEKSVLKSYQLELERRKKSKITLDRLVHEKRTISFPLQRNEDTMNVLVTPILLQGKIYGYISFIKSSDSFGELESDMLERAATICALQILNERTTLETEQRMKAEILDELFSKHDDYNLISARLSYLGYNLRNPHYIFVFQLEYSEVESPVYSKEQLYEMRNQLSKLLQERLATKGIQPIISVKSDRLYTIIAKDFLEDNEFQIKEFGDLIYSKLSQLNPQLSIRLGISSLCESYESYYQGLIEANNALEIMSKKRSTERVILCSDLGYLSLFLHVRNASELERFAVQRLKPLIDYDLRSNSELLKTLHNYIENKYNLYQTARAMSISISGLRYRLQRVQELLQVDFNDTTTRFEVQLALEIYFVINKKFLGG